MLPLPRPPWDLFRDQEEVNDWLELQGKPRVEHPVLDLTQNLVQNAGVHGPWSDLPWEKFLGSRVWASETQAAETAQAALWAETLHPDKPGFDDPALRWWKETYLPQKDGLFRQLQSPGIRRDRVRALLETEQNPAQRGLLEGFLTTEPIPHYNRTSSKTGRLVVRGGANITLLRTEYRPQILQSRWGDQGSLWQFDYNALEPRVALALRNPVLMRFKWLLDTLPRTGPSPSSLPFLTAPTAEDLYLQLQTAYPGPNAGSITRSEWKTAVLSTLYGSQTRDRTLARFLAETFMVEPWIAYLLWQNKLYSGLRVHNYYGRPVHTTTTTQHNTSNTPPPNNHTLFNWFVQSTAVDIALQGFKAIVDRLIRATSPSDNHLTGTNSKILPLFIIHDNLWLDIHNSVAHLVPKLCLVGARHDPALGTFPLTATRVAV